MIAKINLLQPVGYLLVRLLIGLAMMAHGYPKLFASERFLTAFPQMGFPAWSVYLAGSVEVFGGALLVLGLVTRYAAFLISGQMFLAFVFVHWKYAEHGALGFLGRSGDEYPLLLSVATFLLFTAGAGKLSLDSLIFKDRA